MSDLQEMCYLYCENCGSSDGLDVPKDAHIDDSLACFVCGATSRLDQDGGYLTATLEYCRHNRSFDEDCIRCELEGIDYPA